MTFPCSLMGFEKQFSTEYCCSTFSFPFGMTNIAKILGLCSELMREKVVLWAFFLFLILPPAVLWRLSNAFLFVNIPPVTSVPKDGPGGRSCKRSPTSFPDGVIGTILGKNTMYLLLLSATGFHLVYMNAAAWLTAWPFWLHKYLDNHTSKRSWNQSCFCLSACESTVFQR